MPRRPQPSAAFVPQTYVHRRSRRSAEILRRSDAYVSPVQAIQTAQSTISSTQLQALSLRDLIANGSARKALADRIRGSISSTTAVLFFVALVLGYFLGRMRQNHHTAATATKLSKREEAFTMMGEGETPMWLNYGIRKLWKLFKKNTKQFSQEAIQPVLDDVEKPDFVQDVRITQYNVGKHAPLIRHLRPVPARSLAEIQCTYDLLLQSTSDLMFEVDILIPDELSFNALQNKTITIPVSLSNLQIDARMWSAFTMAPYEPYITTWRFSVLETPEVSFHMNVASSLPITAVPGLRSLFFRMIRHEIPKDFMFPHSNTVDFTPKKMRAKKREFTNMTLGEIETLSDDKIKESFPKEWALYHSLDLDESGSLSEMDLKEGLANWGYSTDEAAVYFEKLDPNHKGSVTFPQFCMMWPNVTTSEISQDYEGILSLTVGAVTNLTEPALGWSDPIVEISLGNETVQSALKHGDEGGVEVDEVLELKSESLDDTLKIRIQEDSLLALRSNHVIAKADFPLSNIVGGLNKTVTVDLQPQGTLTLDLSYGKFVDRWNICLHEDDDEKSNDEYSFPPRKVRKLAEEIILH